MFAAVKILLGSKTENEAANNQQIKVVSERLFRRWKFATYVRIDLHKLLSVDLAILSTTITPPVLPNSILRHH